MADLEAGKTEWNLTDLPQLQGSSGVSYNTNSTSNGLLGLSALGLRALSPLRTLVLLDSQRVVGGNFNGVVDIAQMPQLLRRGGYRDRRRVRLPGVRMP